MAHYFLGVILLKTRKQLPYLPYGRKDVTQVINQHRFATVNAGFAPDDISGQLLWLDASDTSTVTHSGGAVSQWDDKSGNNNHAIQPHGPSSPITGSQTINGRNALSFTDDFMAFTNPALLRGVTGATLIAVIEPTNNSAESGHFLHTTTNLSSSWTWSDRRLYENFGYDSRQLLGLIPASDNTPIIHLSRANVSSHTIVYFNGDQYNRKSYGSNYSTKDYGIASEARRLTLNLAEMIVYDSALSVSDCNDLGNYLADKWDIAWSSIQ